MTLSRMFPAAVLVAIAIAYAAWSFGYAKREATAAKLWEVEIVDHDGVLTHQHRFWSPEARVEHDAGGGARLAGSNIGIPLECGELLRMRLRQVDAK